MTTYYLTAYSKEYPSRSWFPREDVRRVECSSRKAADALARAYELELNGGKEWTLDAVAVARHFQQWPCNADADTL